MGSTGSKTASEAATRKYPSTSAAINASISPSTSGIPRPSSLNVNASTSTPSAVKTPEQPKEDELDVLTPEEEASVQNSIKDRRVANTLAGIKFEHIGRPIEPTTVMRKDNEMMDVVRGRLKRRPLRNPYFEDGTGTGTASEQQARTGLLVSELEDVIGLTTRRKLSRKEWTLEEAGARYKLSAKDMEALIRYFNTPTVEAAGEGKLDGVWMEPDEKGRFVRPKE